MTMTDQDLALATQDWTPEAKAKALELAKRKSDPERQVWYCASPGPLCDGQPHEGYPYPHARADQWPPLDLFWFVWLLSGGRGSGKTRSGAEYIRKAKDKVGRINLIAPTTADVRDTMIEGVSGLQAVCAAAGESFHWEPSKRKITFENGCIAKTFSGEEPDRLRGPQAGLAWLDEPAHIPLIDDVWSNLLFGLRLGQKPRIVCTTTPKPTKWLKKLAADERTRRVTVSTRANLSNLAPDFRDLVLSQYEGTRLGRQEIDGELLEDVEGALWTAEMLEHRRDRAKAEDMERIVVAVDPAGSTNNRSDITGIVVVGVLDREGYVFEDASDKYSPDGWARKAIHLADLYGASAIVAEKNYGGDMVKATIRHIDEDIRVIVATASKSKQLRAEPIVGLYEQGRMHHVDALKLADLEDEMLSWVPNESKSPNRIDALVHGATELLKPQKPGSAARPKGHHLPRSGGTQTQSSRRSPGGLILPTTYANPWGRR